MADEIKYSSIGDLVIAAELTESSVLMLLADRAAIGNHPAIYDAGAIQQSAVKKVSAVGLGGYTPLASATDGTASSNSALADASYTITVGPYRKVYQASDLAGMTAAGVLNVDMFSMDAVASYNMALTGVISALASTFSASVGTSGSAATFADFLALGAALDAAKNEGPRLCVLHTDQWNDIYADLLTTPSGAAQWIAATPEQMALNGSGYKGKLCGVDIFTTTTTSDANTGADWVGMMISRGAVLTAYGVPAVVLPAQQMLLGGRVLFELDRTAAAGLTSYVSHGYLGASVGINAAGVKLVTGKR